MVLLKWETKRWILAISPFTVGVAKIKMIKSKDILNLFYYFHDSYSVAGCSDSFANRLALFGRKNGFITGKDVLGSVAFLLNSVPYDKTKKVAIMAHLDSVGYIVSDIYEGELELTAIGDPDIYEEHEGIIYKQGAVSFSDGLECTIVRDKVEDEGSKYLAYATTTSSLNSVDVGDFVSFHGNIKEASRGRVSGPYLDNRAGIMAVLAAILDLSFSSLYPVHVVFSAGEEVGGGYSIAAIEKINPNFIINVDVVNVSNKQQLHSGVNIVTGPYVNNKLSHYLHELAANKKIKSVLTTQYPTYGTDLDVVYSLNGGIPCVDIGPPCLNLHTPFEEAALSSVVHTAKLIQIAIKKMESIFASVY